MVAAYSAALPNRSLTFASLANNANTSPNVIVGSKAIAVGGITMRPPRPTSAVQYELARSIMTTQRPQVNEPKTPLSQPFRNTGTIGRVISTTFGP